jgi:superfamily II DNA or RNA helicase
MKAIKINNTTVELVFDSQKQRDTLASLVSYKVPGYQHTVAFKSGRWKGDKCFLTAANRLKLGLFKTIFPTHSLVFDKDFRDIGFDDIDIFIRLPLERRDYQLEAINTILRNKIGIVNAIMGAGKTLIAAGVCSYHLSQNPKNKVLFVVYDRNILSQTISNFKKYGFNVSQFGSGVKELGGDIVVATIQSLNNIENPKEVLKHVSFVIMDEAHHSGSKTSRSIITKLPNCQYFIGLTATPHVKRSLETAELMSVLGPVIYEYGFSDGIHDKKVAPVKAFFLDVEPDWDIKEAVFPRKNYKFIWDTAIQNNATRNQLIADILHYCVDLLETPNLVLIDRVEHGVSLCDSLKTRGVIKATTMYGSDDIGMREIKKSHLMTDTINTIVSTVIKEGVDFSISPVIAVNASGRKSFVSLIQFLGRITRPNEKFKTFRCYIDFVDHYHPFLREHSLERIEACKSFGVEVVVCKSLKELITEIIKHYKEHN